MAAKWLAQVLAARGIHYGWIIVAITFTFVVCSSAAMSVAGVLVPMISREFGWSIGEISGPLALRLALFGLMAPFAGALMLRYGLRAVVLGSASLLIAGLLVSIGMAAKWQLWLGIGVLLGLAAGMTALVLSATIATRWFTARRGLVLGLMGAGSATGQLVFLPAGAWIAETFGWRAAFVPSVVTIALVAALFVLFVRNDPYELGLAPFGEDQLQEPVQRPETNVLSLSFSVLREATGTLVFWVLAFSFFICGVSSVGLIQPHFVALCSDYGIATVTSASLLAVVGICDLIGTVGSGWLSDRYDNRWLLASYYTFRGVALLWLPYSDFTLVGLSFFAVLFGLDFIATVPPTVKIAAQSFGREKGPIVFGWAFAAHQLGAGMMAFGAGVSRDVLTSFVPAFLAAGLLCLAAALSFTLLWGWKAATSSIVSEAA
ncbi:MFS transporter [Microvirga yunnanensis]|uniref:MFS transporter n=1 Tax=Microvirga yunnanensis TaxID=2953740 RepID=UPI0021C92952|nr:MFS transporter [Microvirga sp. HBU65207]